jgi:FK506-binding nuclear protein
LTISQHYQQTLEITVREGEEIYFSATGSHDIYLTGNYVAFPDEDDEDEDDAADMYGLDAADYDEDEDDFDEDISDSDEDELDALADPRVTEIDSEEEAPKLVKTNKKGKNKRQAEDDDQGEAMTLDELITKTKADAPVANGDEKPNKKQAKKLKNNDGQAVAAAAAPIESKKETKKVDTPNSDKKKVQFAKNLEQGPTGSPKVAEPKKESAKGPRNVGGVTVEDKKEGKGRPAKKGDRIEMRYIGKLKNGKQFDGELPLSSDPCRL